MTHYPNRIGGGDLIFGILCFVILIVSTWLENLAAFSKTHLSTL
jgi:hypothetical protein